MPVVVTKDFLYNGGSSILVDGYELGGDSGYEPTISGGAINFKSRGINSGTHPITGVSTVKVYYGYVAIGPINFTLYNKLCITASGHFNLGYTSETLDTLSRSNIYQEGLYDEMSMLKSLDITGVTGDKYIVLYFSRGYGDYTGICTQIWLEKNTWEPDTSSITSGSVCVEGTTYKIMSGKTLIGGSSYSVTEGKTLIGDTAYRVPIGEVEWDGKIFYNGELFAGEMHTLLGGTGAGYVSGGQPPSAGASGLNLYAAAGYAYVITGGNQYTGPVGGNVARPATVYIGPFDLTDYTYLSMYLYGKGSSPRCYLGCSPDYTTNFTTKSSAKSIAESDIYVLDISSLTGEYYVGFQAIGSNTNWMTIYCYDMYLS